MLLLLTKSKILGNKASAAFIIYCKRILSKRVECSIHLLVHVATGGAAGGAHVGDKLALRYLEMCGKIVVKDRL